MPDFLKTIVSSVSARILAAILAILGLLTGIDWVLGKLHRPLSELLISKVAANSSGAIALKAGHYEIAYPGLFLFAVLFFGFPIVVAAAILITRAHKRAGDNYLTQRTSELESETAQTQTARAALERLQEEAMVTENRQRNEQFRTMNSLKRVVNQLYNPTNPNQDPPFRFNFKTIDITFLISANGDTSVTQTYTVETKNEPGQFWKVKIDVDTYAPPISTLGDLEFSVKSLSDPHSIVSIPVGMSTLRKEIALFFLPEVPSNSSRSFEVKYKCPKWFAELFDHTKRTTNWTWSYDCRDENDQANVRFKFVFDKECGRIECSNQKTALSNDNLRMESENGSTVFIYENDKAPVGRLDWELKFDLL